MKIAYHHRTSGTGAAGIHIKEIVDSFNKLGHKARIFSLTNKNPGRVKSKKSSSVGNNFFKKKYQLCLKKFLQ